MKRVYHRIMAITLMLTMTGFGCNSIAASESEAELQGAGYEAAEESTEQDMTEVSAAYGENKPITDGNYDAALAVKCVNGTFVNTAGRLRWMWSRMMACTRHITSERFPAR